jgi:DNA-directed RNA polymerase subunit M/transcription elongation factor TFIIS
MASVALQQAETVSATRPRCPVCAVAMWLTRIVKHSSGDPRLTRHHYECMACKAEAILPPLED